MGVSLEVLGGADGFDMGEKGVGGGLLLGLLIRELLGVLAVAV